MVSIVKDNFGLSQIFIDITEFVGWSLKVILLHSLGSVEERLFSNGQKNGPAIIKFPNGEIFEFNYKDGEMEGILVDTVFSSTFLLQKFIHLKLCFCHSNVWAAFQFRKSYSYLN